MSARYIIERWPHGWLFCSANGGSGIPAEAFSECMRLFPKDALMIAAIPHHLRAIGKRDVVFCVATKGGVKAWADEIERSIALLPPQERWWKGLDVGASSAAIFAVFCDDNLRFAAQEVGRDGSVPRDSDDFGRCHRLLGIFPEWKANLHRVAEAYPQTKWPAIIARWSEIQNLPVSEANKILASI